MALSLLVLLDMYDLATVGPKNRTWEPEEGTEMNGTWRRVLVGSLVMLLLSLAGLEIMSARVRVEQFPPTTSGDALIERGQDVLTMPGDPLNVELRPTAGREADETVWLAEADR